MNRPTPSKSVFNNNGNNNAYNNDHGKYLDVSDSMSQIGDNVPANKQNLHSMRMN